MYADSLRKNNFFIGKKPAVETTSVAINDSSDVLCFISNKCICKIYDGREMDRRYVQADILFICYC